jgi:hypothetical protein
MTPEMLVILKIIKLSGRSGGWRDDRIDQHLQDDVKRRILNVALVVGEFVDFYVPDELLSRDRLWWILPREISQSLDWRPASSRFYSTIATHCSSRRASVIDETNWRTSPTDFLPSGKYGNRFSTIWEPIPFGCWRTRWFMVHNLQHMILDDIMMSTLYIMP